MTGDEKPKRKWRKLVGIAFSLISLVVLTYIAITLITGRGLDMSWFTRMFSRLETVEAVDELHFDVGRERVFADLDGSLAAAGTLGIQVLDVGGNEILREPLRLSSPAVKSSNGRAIAFDVGGTTVRVFDDRQIISAIEASGEIVSASINRNGWFCVNTQEGSGLRGVATAYNDRGSAVYKVNLASGFVLSSVLSQDNKSLAVLNLTDNGSRVTLYNGLNKQDPDSTFELRGGLILDIQYLTNGSLLAISADSLLLIDKSGVSSLMYEFFDKRLGGYSLDDGYIALHLLDFGVGHGGRLIILNESGLLLGEVITDREILSMSMGGGRLAVLRNDGLVFYDSALEELNLAGDHLSAAGSSRILALGNGAALAAGEHSAVIIRVGD